MTDLDRETLASDVLENWTPPETDTHPDDYTPESFDANGAPLLRCPLVETGENDGAIEGAGGTWWRPKSTAWSVEPSRIQALSPRGRAWLKATHARAAHYSEPGQVDLDLSTFSKASRAAHGKAGRMEFLAARMEDRCPVTAWVGCDPKTGAVVLRLKDVTRGQAAALVEGYSAAGYPLTLRPA